MELIGLSLAPVVATAGRDMLRGACFADSRLESLVLGRDPATLAKYFCVEKIGICGVDLGWPLKDFPGRSRDVGGSQGTSGDLCGPPGPSADPPGPPRNDSIICLIFPNVYAVFFKFP